MRINPLEVKVPREPPPEFRAEHEVQGPPPVHGPSGIHAGLRVYDQVLITPDDRRTVEGYPKWTPDKTTILYDSNKATAGGRVYQVYAYRLTDGVERNLSLDPERNDQFPCLLRLPKCACRRTPLGLREGGKQGSTANHADHAKGMAD